MSLSGIIDMVTSFGTDPTRSVDWGVAELLAILERHEVERAYAHSLRAVHYAGPEGNDETLRACAEHEVLEPVATLDPRRYFDAHEEARRRFEQGCRVFRFFPDVQGWPLELLPFVKICETLAELGARAIVPARSYGEATRVAERLAHLELPVLLIGGRYTNIGELLAVMAEFPNVYCDGHAQNSPYALELIMQQCGEGRVMFGSDSPMREFLPPLLMARHAEITDEQRRRYLHDNAFAFVGEGA
ncbi:MAG: amidohydrolase family protein [Armatimonadota bacterium]